MTKEQERGIEMRNTEERLQDLRDDIRRNKIKACELISEEGKYNLANDIKTVLSMLKEKDKKIELLIETNKEQETIIQDTYIDYNTLEFNRLKKQVKEQKVEIEQQDKMIDLMAEELQKHIFVLHDGDTVTSKKGIIEHYERKATNDG